MIHPFERRLLTAAILVLGLATAASAQKTTGDITGTITDQTGAILPGVTITAVCSATNLTRTAVSDTQGGYSIPELPPCVYKVSSDLSGFKTVIRDVQVAVNAVSKADFKLELGTQSESITVEGVAPLVEFSDKLNNYVDEKRIEQIPLSGRDFNSVIAVTPGVQRRPGGGFLAVNISGSRTTSNNYMIDGISNNDRFYGDSVMNQTGVVGVPATLVPMDAIAEFTVEQTPSAEFGTKGGGVVNVVMKSGSNQVHGSGYYFRHDDWTDSTNYFLQQAGQPTTPVKNQQFGGTFGGPLKKDKTFFFGYYEGQRLSVLSPYQAQVPMPTEIAAARSAIAAAGLTTNPIGEALLKYYPTSPSGSMAIQTPNVSDMNTFAIKIDHQLNTNNLINGRIFYGRSFQSAPAFVGELTPAAGVGPTDMFNSVTNPTAGTLMGLVWNSTLSTTTFLETRFGFDRISQTIGINNNVDPRSLGLDTGPLDQADFGVPAVYMGTFGSIGGVAGYPITTAPTESYNGSSSLTTTRGQHTIKVGGSFERATTYSVRDRARTSLVINTSNDVAALEQLLLGRFDSAGRSFGATQRNLYQNSAAAYVSDDWKMTSRLTISGGLRFDWFGPMGEINGLAGNFIPGQGLVRLGQGLDQLYNNQNDLGPRAGFAWDVTGDGKTSIRGGYSLAYDVLNFKTLHSPNTTWGGLAAQAGVVSEPIEGIGVYSKSLNGLGSVAAINGAASCVDPVTGRGDYVCAVTGVPLFGGNPAGTPPFNAFAVPLNFKTPRYHYFHMSVQREVFKENAITVSYVGSRGRDLAMYRDINGTPVGTPLNAIQQNRPYYGQFPDLKHIIEVTNDGRSWYDSVQFSWRQNNWHGINTQYNYTLSRCRDYNSSNYSGRNNFPVLNNPYDPSANLGPCDYDVPQNFNVSGSYQLPETNRLGTIGRGWQIGTVFTALSGRPFTANLATQDKTGQDTYATRAMCLAAPVYDYSNPDAFITNVSQAFGVPGPNQIGSCGRNSLRGPGFAQWDMNFVKVFQPASGVQVQARWEIFNLLNRVNLGSPLTTNVRSGLFGQIGSTPDVDAGNPVMAAGGARAMQWAVKVLF